MYAELKQIQKEALAETISLTDTVEGWLYWFGKRGDRYLKDAAKNGYSEIILDLPLEIAQSMDRVALGMIQRTLREQLKGCFIGFIEDEYDDKPLVRLLISWK